MEQSARASASIRDTRNLQEPIRDSFVFRLGCGTYSESLILGAGYKSPYWLSIKLTKFVLSTQNFVGIRRSVFCFFRELLHISVSNTTYCCQCQPLVLSLATSSPSSRTVLQSTMSATLLHHYCHQSLLTSPVHHCGHRTEQPGSNPVDVIWASIVQKRFYHCQIRDIDHLK